MGSYLLPDRLNAQWYCGLLETGLPGLLERCASSCEAGVVVSAWRNSSALWGPCLAAFQSTISRKVDWMLMTNCVASLPAGPNSDRFFPVGTSERVCFCSPSQHYWRPCGKISNSYDNGWCLYVKVRSRELCAAHCYLPWNGWRLFQTPAVTMKNPWFDHLIACAIWCWCACTLETKCHRIHVVQYNWLIFFLNKESYYWQLAHGFCFTL
jgi:hypothetical protein